MPESYTPPALSRLCGIFSKKLTFFSNFWIQKLTHNISFWLISTYHVRVDLMFKALLYFVVNVITRTSNEKNCYP